MIFLAQVGCGPVGRLATMYVASISISIFFFSPPPFFCRCYFPHRRSAQIKKVTGVPNNLGETPDPFGQFLGT